MKPTTLIRVHSGLTLAAVCPYCHQWILYEDNQLVLFHYCYKCNRVFLTYRNFQGRIDVYYDKG